MSTLTNSRLFSPGGVNRTVLACPPGRSSDSYRCTVWSLYSFRSWSYDKYELVLEQGIELAQVAAKPAAPEPTTAIFMLKSETDSLAWRLAAGITLPFMVIVQEADWRKNTDSEWTSLVRLGGLCQGCLSAVTLLPAPSL